MTPMALTYPGDPAPEVEWRERRPAACYAGTCAHRQHDGHPNPRITPKETPVTEINAIETIDMTPDAQGWENIARTFALSTISDFTPKRRDDARHILDSLVEIVAYLARTDPARVAAIRATILPPEAKVTIR